MHAQDQQTQFLASNEKNPYCAPLVWVNLQEVEVYALSPKEMVVREKAWSVRFINSQVQKDCVNSFALDSRNSSCG